MPAIAVPRYMVIPSKGSHSSDLTGDTMGAEVYQRRTQKGIGWNGKTVQRCTGKTPRNNAAKFAWSALDM
jgi:hypothetical protein